MNRLASTLIKRGPGTKYSRTDTDYRAAVAQRSGGLVLPDAMLVPLSKNCDTLDLMVTKSCSFLPSFIAVYPTTSTSMIQSVFNWPN